MNELMLFKNEEFGEIRTVKINDEIYFIGRDITTALGYKNGIRDINRHVDKEDRMRYRLGTPSRGIQTMTVINESGVYSLIFGSKLESAKRFKHWVTSVVLPAIRKTGGYISGEEELEETELVLRAMTVLQKKVEILNKKTEELENKTEEQKRKLDEQEPKVFLADSITASKDCILIRDLAKILHQNGVDIGEKRLFKYLREKGYLISDIFEDRNSPTQKSMSLGLFMVEERTFYTPYGDSKIARTTKVTPKGQEYFIKKLVKEQLNKY